MRRLLLASTAFFCAAIPALGAPLELRDFRARGDGVTDDTAAVQKAVNTAIATGQMLHCGPGRYRITSTVQGFSSSNNYIIEGTGETDAVGAGCNFYADFNGWGLAVFDFTNQSTPSTRSAGITLRNFSITYNPALTAPPIGIKHRYSSNDHFERVQVLQLGTVNRGTAISVSGVWNARYRWVQSWGAGGYKSAHLVASGTTFSITAASTTLTSNQAEFLSSDVGLCIMLAFNASGVIHRDDEQFCITGYTSSTQVTVGRAATFTHTDVPGAFSSLRGSISASSNSLTQSTTALTSADVGRVIYVPGAGADWGNSARGALRATITAVSGTTVTLDTAATATSNDVELVIDPAFDVWAESASITPNDVILDGFLAAQTPGVGLAVFIGQEVNCVNCKVSGTTNSSTFGQTNLELQANTIFFDSNNNYIEGLFDGRSLSAEGAIWSHGSTNGNTIGPISAASVFSGHPFLSLKKNGTKSAHAIGPVRTWNNVDPAFNSSLINTDGQGEISTPWLFQSYTASPVVLSANLFPYRGVVNGQSSQSITAGLTRYYVFNNFSGTYSGVAVPVARKGTFKNFYMTVSAAPAGSETAIATLYVNGSATNVTCTITGSATSCSDTTHSAAITAGQDYAVQVVTSASAATLFARHSFELESTGP